MKILVIRNDKLGDFMLVWPALALLKRSINDAHITAILPPYTADLGRACPWIDTVIEDPEQLHTLKRGQFDAMITFFSTFRMGWLGFKLGISQRIAPATKVAQIFYPHRLTQRRSQSIKAEYEYNVDLVHHFLNHNNVPATHTNDTPYWSLCDEIITKNKQSLAKQLNINPKNPWFFIHPGHGGSANNLSLEQYAELITLTNKYNNQNTEQKIEWVLTAGPGETDNAKVVQNQVKHSSEAMPALLNSTGSIEDFAHQLACADIFIAGSTGTLHLAGVLDVPTVGFFPNSRACNSTRWRPCNSEKHHLALSPDTHANADDSDDMQKIDLDDCAQRIVAFVQNLEKPKT